uniref:NADH-ubiquinone oxidoreductase chain 3 n=1 Tax=Matrona basilaris TaxID=101727 RepID=A0A6M4B8V3_9ODON|nr:NADH dehydrogenase subunit 3 [Matrona cyanoptera]QJQ37707.1 NADH dehydrogenase subunit 3 [Matrona basilaris]QJQ37720.1 NADH dehydrogenase subunit 3 [Matrona basilaris]UZA66676.1 NADH dehydrogenase subunit 3 [Matrona cyanoptera]
MNILMLTGIIIMTITMIIMSMASLLSKKSIIDREKSTPFECGFDPFYKARIPFSLKFFLVAVIFLIFDVEIAIIMPTMMSMKSSDPMQWGVSFTIVIVILLVGLYYEWIQGSLEWTT